MMHLKRRHRRASEPSGIVLSPLGHARLARLAWVKPDRWQEVWRLESDRGVHAECWTVDAWKGETGVRFADPPELRLRTKWNGNLELTAVGEDAPRLSHHTGWLGRSEWRRAGAASLTWRGVRGAGHRLEDADGQMLLQMRTRSTGWFDWNHEVEIADAARRRPDLAELLAMSVYVTMGGGRAPS